MSVKQILLLFFANRNFILDLVSRLKQIFCRLFPPEMRKNESECPRSVNFFLYNLDNDVFMVFHFKNRPRKKNNKNKRENKNCEKQISKWIQNFFRRVIYFFHSQPNFCLKKICTGATSAGYFLAEGRFVKQ